MDIENEHILHKSVVNTIEYYYDAQGNPISYLGHTLTWEKGRQLKQFVKSDGTSISYTYNANGIRTSKTVNGIKHTYTLDGTKILREEWGENSIVPLYDNEESVCGILYNDEPYYFTKNLQGDIISIVNKAGGTVARYSYNAWGVPTITEDVLPCRVAEINPYRYRGYYYDGEIGLYYVSSRYYDPAVGRWLNEDEGIYSVIPFGRLQHNLFSYCANDFVNNVDYSGYWWFSISIEVVAVLLDALITWLLPYIFTAFKATKLLKWAKFSRWFRNKFNSAVKGLAKLIYNALDGLVYRIVGKAANAATRAFTLSGIQRWVENILNFSIGYGIAWIIDHFDGDGKSGYIQY